MEQLLDPAILFFCFGIAAGLLGSNLEIPPAIARFLSLYLLMALGLKGGFALAASGLAGQVLASLTAAVVLAVAVPLASYALLRRSLNGFDAAAIAATYGSVSAVTFITAVQYLDAQGLPYGGHMAAAMALMESPAIVLGVLLANRVRRQQGTSQTVPLRGVLRESMTDGAQLLLLGAMVIGMLSGERAEAAMRPFTSDLFKGMLAFFLLDMGLSCARQVGELRGAPRWLLVYALTAPLAQATAALGLGTLFGLEAGNLALLMVLAASGSYIAVPAVVRHAIPEARPSLYLGLSLGLTFPFNILVGIPLYVRLAHG
ncbi:MAG: sodium-dependent bicarbonate transport family permease [Burkholderiaceae bacterium]|nr:sodium-dependent bicarbonate transport family permease [Burkholderiaceae bacterium]